MVQKYKYTRPENPLTPKVMENIDIKTNILLRTFKDYDNTEKRDYRRNDIVSRLASAATKAFQKFQDNNKCSFESFADVFITREVKHYCRDTWRLIQRDSCLVSYDRPMNDDDDTLTYISEMSDPRDRFEDGLDRIDFADILTILRRRNPTYARIFSLRRQGYTLREIAPIINVPEWELYDILWPAVREEVKKIYDFIR